MCGCVGRSWCGLGVCGLDHPPAQRKWYRFENQVCVEMKDFVSLLHPLLLLETRENSPPSPRPPRQLFLTKKVIVLASPLPG